MSTRLIVASVAAALVTALPSDSASALQAERSAAPRESRIPVGQASLYSREIGRGQPHHRPPRRARFRPRLSPARSGSIGGCIPPHLLRPAGTWEIRGSRAARGRHARVRRRRSRQGEAALSPGITRVARALLGRGSGPGVRASTPDARVSPDPDESRAGVCKRPRGVSEGVRRKLGADMDRQREIVASAAYQEGDPEAVAARYRLHFKPALDATRGLREADGDDESGIHQPGERGHREGASGRGPADARHLAGGRLRSAAEAADPEHPDPGHLWRSRLHSRRDRARTSRGPFRTLSWSRSKSCGHFAYLECAGDVRKAFDDFFRQPRPPVRPPGAR